MVTSGGGHRLVVGRGGQREERGEVGGLPPRQLLRDEPQAERRDVQRPVPVHPHHEPATGAGVDVRVAAGVDPGEDDGDGGTLVLSAQLVGDRRERVICRVVGSGGGCDEGDVRCRDWTTRSRTAGTPRFLVPPDAFGMVTRRTGNGR